MYVSNETLEIVGQSLASDMYYIRDVCANFWNWVIDTWSIKEWNPRWDKVWDTTKVWDTKRYDEAYSDLNLLDTDHLVSHEKTD